MDPFVAQLADLCRAHPTRAKWVIVPTHAMGRTLGDRLVLEGTDWANLRFVTPLDLALRMAAPFLVERGIDPSEEGLGPSLIMRLFLDLGGERAVVRRSAQREGGLALRSLGEGGYFRPLADQPELARALWSTISELRMAGIASTDLKPSAFESADKHAELQAVLTAYEQYLTTEKRGDRATVFAEALEHLEWCPIQKQDCWLEAPEVVWPPRAQRLFDMLPGEHVQPAAIRLDEPSAHVATTTFFHAGGAEAEVEEVFRRVLASGRSIDEVEIVCPQLGSALLVWEKALRYEWPITLAAGLPSSLTRPGRALAAFVEWIEDDFSSGRLRKLLQSGDIAVPATEATKSLSAASAARLLVKAGTAWGRDTYRLALGRLARSQRKAADRDDLSDADRQGLLDGAEQVEALAGWLTGLINSVPPGSLNDRIELQSLVSCAAAFVETTAARTSSLDRAGTAALTSSLEELRGLGKFQCTLSQGLRHLAERATGAVVGRDRPRPGHLHVSRLSGAGLSGRPLIFIVGLEEGRVFPAGFEDPILLDRERAALTATLPTSAQRLDESVHAALARLSVLSASASTHLCLSYSCRDLREFRQTYASWLMLDVYRTATGNAQATYPELRASLGTPVSCVPGDADAVLGPSRWWLRGMAQAGDPGRASVFASFDGLNRGERARAARASTDFTEFDGYVPAAGAELDPANPARIVSPTDLEKAASCPFKYFLERGLRVRAIEVGDRDRDVWLNPLLKGSLLHDLYARAMRRARAEKRSVTATLDETWLVDQGRAALLELSTEMPAPSPEVHDLESDELLQDLRFFVAEEASRSSTCRPVGFEVPFGRGEAPEEDLAGADPITIDIDSGLTIRLAGRIDRIDELLDPAGKPSATFEIIDYKTGGYFEPNWKGTFAGGSRLQHALYGLAAAELIRRRAKTSSSKLPEPKVARATYYFSSAKGKQVRKAIDAVPLAKTTAVLTDLRNVIAAGAFIHAREDSHCSFCDHGFACGRDASGKAQAKMADPKLTDIVRLDGHE